jgi:hypothetical protein
VILRVRVQPRSSKNGIVGVVGGSLKVCVNAPAAEGAANRACRETLAKALGVSKSRIEIVSGHKSREKRVLLREADEEAVSSRIAELLDKLQ